MSIPYPTVYAEEQNELDDNVGMENDAQMTAMIDEILAKKAIRTHSTPVALPLASGMRNKEGMKGSALPEHSKLREEVERRRKQRITSLAPKKATKQVKKPFNETKEEKKRAKKLLKLQKKAVDRGLEQLDKNLKAKEGELEALRIVMAAPDSMTAGNKYRYKELESEINSLRKQIKKNKKVSKKKLEEKLQMDTESVVRLLKLDPKVFNTFLKQAQDVLDKQPKTHLEDISRIPSLTASILSEDMAGTYPPEVKKIEQNLIHNFTRVNELIDMLAYDGDKYNALIEDARFDDVQNILKNRRRITKDLKKLIAKIKKDIPAMGLTKSELEGYNIDMLEVEESLDRIKLDTNNLASYISKGKTKDAKTKGKEKPISEETEIQKFHRELAELKEEARNLEGYISDLQTDWNNTFYSDVTTPVDDDKAATLLDEIDKSKLQLEHIKEKIKDLEGSQGAGLALKKHRKRKV